MTTRPRPKRSSPYATICWVEAKTIPYTPGFTDKELAECFSKHFISKIANIRDTLTAKQGQLQPPPVLHQSTVPCMDTFRLLSDDEVSVIVKKSPTKTCEADPIPTALLKDVLPNVKCKCSISKTSFEENKFGSC